MSAMTRFAARPVDVTAITIDEITPLEKRTAPPGPRRARVGAVTLTCVHAHRRSAGQLGAHLERGRSQRPTYLVAAAATLPLVI